MGTRGTLAQDLRENSLWWHGPPWKTESSTNWPQTEPTKSQIPDERKVNVLTVATESEDPLARFSSYDRALRVIGYAMRFVNPA